MYTILLTEFSYGQINERKEKDEVKPECERLRKIFSKTTDKNAYIRIEVINEETGEMREYWNNKENTLNF